MSLFHIQLQLCDNKVDAKFGHLDYMFVLTIHEQKIGYTGISIISSST